jgi:starch-binding outer membrane protein, SusD/RagB family
MKKRIIFITLIFIAGAFFSCSKSFLDVPVQGGETTTADPTLAQKLVTGVYHSLMQGDSWGNGDVHGFAFISATNIMSDDADKGSYLGDQSDVVAPMDDFTLTATNEFALTLWSGHYNAIGAANQALQALATASIDTVTKVELMAEVRFIRGYLYFNLVRMFGGVPIILRVPKDATDANTDPAFQTRATDSAVYNTLILDLQFAVDHLPLKAAAQVGHATKGTAEGILAKVYMYQKQWKKCFDLTNDIISSGQYQLLSDYSLIWRQASENSSESIFEIETGAFNNANLKVDNYTVCQGPRVGGAGGWDDLGWGFNGPTASLINSYEPGDVRRDATVIFIDNSGTHKGTVLWDGFRIPSSDSCQNLFYNYKAYTSKSKETYSDPADKDRPKNIRILRYADVLLMNAEAALQPEVNQPSQAVADVAPLRQRAQLPPKGALTIDDIWQERHVELAMEHDRFWDIVRQGRAAQVMHAAGKPNFVAGKNELLPIPSSQIQLSANKLTQNPGY